MENMQQNLDDVNKSIGFLSEKYPEYMNAFGNFMNVVEKDSALSKKTKEIISVALSVVKQCKYCIAFHVHNALKAGATKEELVEACFVASLMGGGPSLMYSQLVFQAIEEFKKE